MIENKLNKSAEYVSLEELENYIHVKEEKKKNFRKLMMMNLLLVLLGIIVAFFEFAFENKVAYIVVLGITIIHMIYTMIYENYLFKNRKI